jgi:Secretion system C-terminal sorting domain
MFFRVKNIDFDGRSKYSSIVKVYLWEQPSNTQIQLYPVPVADQLTMQHNKFPEHIIFTIINTNGKILRQVAASLNTLQTQVNIANGIYIVKYDDRSGEVQSLKSIKK